MPEREIHLLAGAAGTGKTTLALQILGAIQRGEPVFGRRTWPTKVMIVSLDRSRAAHTRMIDGLAVPEHEFKFFSQRNQPTSIRLICQITRREEYNGCKLIFIDGFGTLVRDGKLADYQATSDFLREAGALCEEYGVTIIGSVHATKTKEGESYANPRQRVLGSVAWAAFSDLIITVDPEKPSDVSNMVRLVNVLPRNDREFMIKYLREGSRMLPYEDPAELDLASILDYWLVQNSDRKIPTREFIGQGRDAALTPRQVERWIERQLESGRLERTSKGIYQVVPKQ